MFAWILLWLRVVGLIVSCAPFFCYCRYYLLSVVVAFLGHTKRSQAELDVSLQFWLILYYNESCFLFEC